MTNKDTSISFFEKRKEASLPKQGPYADARNELLHLLTEAKRFSLLKKISSGNYVWRCQKYVTEGFSTIELQIEFKTALLQVAVSSGQATGGRIQYYELTDSGHAINLDELSPDSEVWEHLGAHIRAASRDLEQLIARKVRDRQDRRDSVRKGTLISAIVLFVIALGFMCIRWWIFEPLEADNRARVAYNAGNHQIESAGYPVDAHSLASVPSGSLQSIPNYGGDDKTLTHPRTISITYGSSSGWCSSINVDIPSGSNLAVAVANDSLFIRDHYVATYTNRSLTVCLVDGFSKNEASKTVSAKLVLQVKLQNSAE